MFTLSWYVTSVSSVVHGISTVLFRVNKVSKVVVMKIIKKKKKKKKAVATLDPFTKSPNDPMMVEVVYYTRK